MCPVDVSIRLGNAALILKWRCRNYDYDYYRILATETRCVQWLRPNKLISQCFNSHRGPLILCTLTFLDIVSNVQRIVLGRSPVEQRHHGIFSAAHVGLGCVTNHLPPTPLQSSSTMASAARGRPTCSSRSSSCSPGPRPRPGSA